MIDGTPGLARALQKGRLVIFLGARLPEGKKLPRCFRVVVDRAYVPDARPVVRAQDIEGGGVRKIPAGAVVEIRAWDALGTPRRPTRVRAWVKEILRERTVLFVVSPDQQEAVRRLLGSSGRHVVVNDEEAGALLDELGTAPQGLPKAPPPLPGASSRVGVLSLAVASAVCAFSWLWLYLWAEAAQNWRWVRLIPASVIAGAVLLGSLPLFGRMLRAQDLPISESYARSLARWSRWPRAAMMSLLILLSALIPWMMVRTHVPATFLVTYEAAGVSLDGRFVGACKAEEPCTLVVPRYSHLHFEGAEGACGLDLPEERRLIIIDLQEEGCELPEESAGPPPRG